MALRMLQVGLGGLDCTYGMLLLALYGRDVWHLGGWHWLAVGLIVASVLPASVLSVRFPVPAGIGQFACAFLGRQMLHHGPWPDVELYAALSMTLAVALVGIAVVRGVVEITREAYGEAEQQDDRCAAEGSGEAGELNAAAAGGARNQLWF